MTFATVPTRRLITLGVALAVGATVLGAPAAVAATPPEGAYWHTKTMTTTSTHPRQFGSKSDAYSLVQREISERWSAPDGRNWFGYRELGTLPGTVADKKAWRRDGSPSTWNESIDGKTVKLSAEPAKGRLAPAGRERKFWVAEQWLTYDEVQRLPADPSRLKDWLTKAGQVGREDDIPGWLEYTLPEFLHDFPAPKEVRTAAYQALLTLPGVRAGGAAKDGLGRPGAAVVLDSSSGKGKKATVVKVSLIVDTGRMVLLSRDQKATLDGKAFPEMSSNKTLIQVGWTDSPPAVPALS